MNKALIIASAATAAAGALFYLTWWKKRITKPVLRMPVHRSRHRTEVFAHAKHA